LIQEVLGEVTYKLDRWVVKQNLSVITIPGLVMRTH